VRKIIPIVDTPASNASQGYLTALCDDGTLWIFGAGSWCVINVPIPQDPINLIYPQVENDDN